MYSTLAAGVLAEIATHLDALVASGLVPLALFIVLNGLDDLVIDAAIAWAWWKRRRQGNSVTVVPAAPKPGPARAVP